MSKCIYGNTIGGGAGLPKSYVLETEDGSQKFFGVLVGEETVLTANAHTDIREGVIAATENGVEVGSKFIPSYNTISGKRKITSGASLVIPLYDYSLNLSDFTELQVIVCDFDGNITNSVAATKVVISNKVYEVGSSAVLAEVTKDLDNKKINLGIINESENACVMRYLLYKEIY